MVSPRNLVNLTPHEIIFRTSRGDIHLPSAGIARMETVQTAAEPIEDIPVTTTEYRKVTGLPEPDGRTFIVSSIVAMLVPRPDLVAPDTGPTAIREHGQVVAVTRLQRFHSASGQSW